MVKRFAGVFKRFKDIGLNIMKKIGKTQKFIASKILKPVVSVAKPLIDKIPTVGPALGYVTERYPGSVEAIGQLFENVGSGQNVGKSVQQFDRSLNDLFPANPIGFGYNTAQAYKKGGVKEVIKKFGPEEKVFLDTLMSMK